MPVGVPFHKSMTAMLSVEIVVLSICVMPVAAQSDKPCGEVILSLDKQVVLGGGQRKPPTLLTLAELPKESKVAQGLELGNDTFGQACLSPGGDLLAFTVKGSIHDWIGLFALKTRQANELDFLFEGSAGAISWSPNNQFFSVEIVPPSGYRTVTVYEVKNKKSLRSLDEYLDRDGPIEAWAPEWTADGNTLKFKTKRPGRAESVEQFLINTPSPQKKSILSRNPLTVLLFVCFLIVGLLYHFARPRHSV